MKYLSGLAFAAIVVGCLMVGDSEGQSSGGLPSRPVFQTVTVKNTAGIAITPTTGSANLAITSPSGTFASMGFQSGASTSAAGICVSDTSAQCIATSLLHDVVMSFTGILRLVNGNGSVTYGDIGPIWHVGATSLPKTVFGSWTDSAGGCVLVAAATTQNSGLGACVRNSIGNYTITFSGGLTFANPPMCIGAIQGFDASSGIDVIQTSSTTTTVTVFTASYAAFIGAPTNRDTGAFFVTCMGF